MKLAFNVIIFSILLFCNQNSFSQIIFDDFSYKSTDYPAADSANSLFGNNIWLTGKGDTLCMAWIKGSTWGPTPHYRIEPSNEGVKLKLLKGMVPEEVTPDIQSRFLRKHGTFASRIKFGDLRLNTCINQAYFLYNASQFTFYKNNEKISNWEEMDFEYMNCAVQNEIVMAEEAWANNNRNGCCVNFSNIRLNAVWEGKIIPLKNIWDEFFGKPPLAGQWATCMFVIDSVKRTVRISLRVSDFDSTGIMIYSSASTDINEFNKPLGTDNYDMFSTITVVFSNTGNPSFDESELNIDWFYYSEKTDMDFNSIEDSVRVLQKKGIKRINTSDAILNTFNFDWVPGELYIDGPDEIEQCKESSWVLKHHDYRWGGYITDFLYRFHDKERGWGDWRNLYSIYVVLSPEVFFDSLEFNVVYHEYWLPDSIGTYNKKVRILAGNSIINQDIILNEPIPNPANSQVALEFSVYKNCNLTFKIYDDIGNTVAEIASGVFQKGNYYYILKTDKLCKGIYFVVLKTETEKAMKILNISRTR